MLSAVQRGACTLRLYRGIAVPEAAAASVMDGILQNGLLVEGRFWSGLAVPDLKPRLDDLWRSQDLTLENTRSEDVSALPRVCACADRSSAMYYACSHNRTGDHVASILITFDADLADVIIDGRDFLYTVMQIGYPAAGREPLKRIFGSAVLRYADRAWSMPASDQRNRVACCDLATQDTDVIRAPRRTLSSSGGATARVSSRRSWLRHLFP